MCIVRESRLAGFFSRSARTAGTKIDLRFPRLFVCLFVCLSVVCASRLSRAQNITPYVTMQLQCIAAFGGCGPNYSK